MKTTCCLLLRIKGEPGVDWLREERKMCTGGEKRGRCVLVERRKEDVHWWREEMAKIEQEDCEEKI
jgi:hypothetical protein